MALRRASARRLLIAFAALAAALALPALASAKSNLQVGFIDNAYANSAPSAFWSDAQALDVGALRYDMQWKHIAPTKPANPRDPADPAYQWASSDQFVLGAAAHGLTDRVMFTLWATPDWATTAKTAKSAQMPNLKAWKDFAFACATRYSGAYTPAGASAPLPRVTAWETWNEPNGSFALLPQKKNGKWVSPSNYVKLLNALKGQVNAALPFKPTFVAGALYKQGSASNPTPIQFMEGMKAAGAKFDVLSMHPYNNVPRLGLKDGVAQSKTNPSFIGVGNFQTFITRANQIFGRKYPIWVTEFGWATPAVGKSQYTVSFNQQAQFAYESILRFKQLPQVERMVWFLIKDDPPSGTGAWYSTGLRKLNDAEKPSYGSWQSAAAKLRRSPIH
ncbi:MAG: glycosyl hydrolase [Gaiellales bacterium]